LSIWLNIVVLSVAPCLLFLLFPDGRLPSARWRPAVWLVVVTSGGIFLTLAFAPGELDQYTYPGLPNPLGIGGAVGDVLSAAEDAGNGILPIAILVSISSMIVRFRRSSGRERLQLKWVAYTAALMAASFLVSFVLPEPVPQAIQDAVFFLGVAAFAAIPIAAGIAILRYRLYDIDLLINRTLVYGSLTLSLAAIYAGGIVLIQGLFRALTGQETQLAIVASTLAIAALFNPLRRPRAGFHRPPLLPPQVRREKDPRIFLGEASGRDGSEPPRRRAGLRGAGNGTAGARLAVAASSRVGQERRKVEPKCEKIAGEGFVTLFVTLGRR
jgi:hypothetical protein